MDRESNAALLSLSRKWKLQGDWMVCRECGRVLVASRDGEALIHKSGCKNQNFQHPWTDLRSILGPPALSTESPHG